MTYQPPSYPAGQPQPSQPLGASDPSDLTLPLYGATFGQAISRFFKNYANFSGRASRSEYWWAVLFQALVALVPSILFSVGLGSGIVWAASNAGTSVGSDPLTGETTEGLLEPGVVNAPGFGIAWIGLAICVILWLAFLVPHLALTWRRLHDANLAGPFYFLNFIPSVGSIVLLVLVLLPPQPLGARFDRR